MCWPTWIPSLGLAWFMMKSMALQHKTLAKTHPCLTPSELVLNGEERWPARQTLAVVVELVAVCRSIIRSRTTFDTPIPFMAFQCANLSAESKADFRFTNAENSGC